MTVRDRLIHSTIDLVRRHGVAGTGISAILEHGNVSRRSIYLTFPDGKAELVQESTRVAGAFIEDQISAALALPTPQEALAAFISGWKRIVADSEFTAGCPIAAAGQSRSSEPQIADVAGQTFARWQQMIGDSLHGHGIAAQAAITLATTVVAAVEGAVLLAVAQKSLRPLDDVHDQLDVLVGCHLDHADSRARRPQRK